MKIEIEQLRNGYLVLIYKHENEKRLSNAVHFECAYDANQYISKSLEKHFCI